MRRPAVFALLLSLVLGLLAPPASAGPRQIVRSYVGTTSAGDSITLFTAVRGETVRFLALGLEGIAACDDGTSVPVADGVDTSPRGVRLDDGVLDLDLRTFSSAFSVDGTIGTRRASGTITYVVATLDANEDARRCSTGDLTWTAEREPAATAIGGAAAPLVAGLRNAAVVRLEEGAPARRIAPGRERLRSYEGRTSAGLPLFVVTARTSTAIELRELGLSWHLACEDGTSSIDLGVFISFFGQLVERGRFDYDSAGPEIALHVNGTLDAHLGEGTTSIAMPALTDDLRAQACRSGELTWRAWRVDAGARRA